MKWLNEWLADLPSLNLKIAAATLMFVGFCLTCFVCMVTGKELDEGMVLAVGSVILAFAGVTSFDFRTKRTTEILRPPEVMASHTAGVTTVASPAPAKRLAPADATVAHARAQLAPPARLNPRGEAGTADDTTPLPAAPTPIPPEGP